MLSQKIQKYIKDHSFCSDLKEPIKTNKKDYIYKIMLYQTKKMEYICLCIAKRMPFNVHLTIGIKRLKMSMRIGMIL